jgi:hypothetical protein
MSDNATPSLELAFTSRHHYYESLRPCAEHRYAPPCEVHSLSLLPWHLGDRFSRSAQEPGVRSRCLYTGCRLAKTWGDRQTDFGDALSSDFGIVVNPFFDTSLAVRLCSSSNTTPDGCFRLFLNAHHQDS